MIMYTNGIYLQSFPVPEGQEWRVATAEDIEAIEAPNRLLRAGMIEDEWRDEQMARVANQLLMIEDEDPKAEAGTARQWRDYRIDLRSWAAESPDFPDCSKRPVAPA